MSSAKGVRFMFYLWGRFVLSRGARMVIRYAEWLSATQNGYPLRGMVIRVAEWLSANAELRRISAEAEIFDCYCKTIEGKLWSTF